MALPHHADGEPCRCREVYSDHPRNYVKGHPNKVNKNGATFNEEIAAAIKKSNESRTSQ